MVPSLKGPHIGNSTPVLVEDRWKRTAIESFVRAVPASERVNVVTIIPRERTRTKRVL
jgi:hypothetical protein